MVTKITDITKYQGLFKKAWDELEARNVFTEKELLYYHGLNNTFTCLEDYFTRINTLIDVDTANKAKYPATFKKVVIDEESDEPVVQTVDNPKYNQLIPMDYEYIMLPVDEPILEIDANTREIKIPAGFKKSIGVQGDHYAETLMFSIDRFYDYIDLYPSVANNMQIYVQWTDENKDDRATAISMIRYDANNQKIIFGWPIDGKITETARTFNFSVRFFMRDAADEIYYSFSTKPHSLSISAALQADLKKVQVDTAPLGFLNAINNSISTNSPAAEVPSFKAPGCDLFTEVDVPTLGTEDYVLTVQAFTTDGGVINYPKWVYQAEGSEDVSILPGTLTYAITKNKDDGGRIKTGDGTVYYTAVEGTNPVEYVKYLGDPNATDKDLYEQYYTYTIPKDAEKICGTYKAYATNRTGSNISPLTPSTVLHIYGPEEVQLITDLDENYTMTPTKKQLETEISVKDAKNTKINYTWKFSDSSSKESDLQILDDDDVEYSNILPITTSGWYKMDAVITRNRKSVEQHSKICRVVEMPTKPIAQSESGLLFDLSTASDYATLKVSATVTVPEGKSAFLYSDDLEYVWEAQKPDVDWTVITEENRSNYRVVAGSSINSDALNVTGEPGTGDLSKAISYRCYIYNVLNGKKSEAALVEGYTVQ